MKNITVMYFELGGLHPPHPTAWGSDPDPVFVTMFTSISTCLKNLFSLGHFQSLYGNAKSVTKFNVKHGINRQTCVHTHINANFSKEKKLEK